MFRKAFRAREHSVASSVSESEIAEKDKKSIMEGFVCHIPHTPLLFKLYLFLSSKTTAICPSDRQTEE